MKRLIASLLLLAIPAMGSFVTNTTTATLTTTTLSDYADYSWKWSALDDQKLDITFDRDVSGTNTAVAFRLNRKKTGDTQLEVSGFVVTAVNAVISFSGTNLPKNATYYAEFMHYYTNTTTSVVQYRSLSKGKVTIVNSLFQSDVTAETSTRVAPLYGADTLTTPDIGVTVQAYDVQLTTLATPTIWSLIYGNATTYAYLGLGTAGKVLTSGGTTNAPTWVTPTTGDITGVSITAGTGMTGTVATTSGVHTQTLALSAASVASLLLADNAEPADAAIAKTDEAETLSANWVNTAHPWAANEITEADPIWAAVSNLYVLAVNLGTAAYSNAADFATAAQGLLAVSAVQRAGDTMTGTLTMGANPIIGENLHLDMSNGIISDSDGGARAISVPDGEFEGAWQFDNGLDVYNAALDMHTQDIINAGTVAATAFAGGGSGLTALPAAQLTGNVPIARMTNGLANPGATLALAEDGSAVTMGGSLSVNPVGSGRWTFSNRSDFLALQNQKTGSFAVIDIFAKDGDGTDDVGFEVFSKGTPASISTSERLIFKMDAAGQAEINTAAGGGGTQRPIYIWAESGSSPIPQLYLGTDGNVGIGTNAPADKFHVATTNAAIALDSRSSAPAAYASGAQLYSLSDGGANTNELFCMDGQGNAVKLSGSPMGKHTIEKHNIWTGVGQGVDLIKLAKAVEALSGNPGSLVYEFTKPRKDWDKVEAAKVAKRDAAISEWVKATEAYAVYTNTTLPAYKAKASAHRSDVAAHKAWTRRGAAYAAWLALTPEEDVDTPMPPQAGTEPAIRVAPEQPEAVGEPGDEPEPKIAAKMPQWLKDWEKGNGHGRVTR